MTSWMNDAAHQNGTSFTHLDQNAGAMLDQTSFMANNSSFDPSQFQNQQLQQRMQNGALRNASPSPFSNPQYQTNSVIPSKRPREVSLGTSPRQTPGILPNSRSQTPQQNSYPPYSHLQNGSANASPSPIMANQIRPGGVPQRVSTASPHPFSPAGQQFAPQPSPSQSEQGRSDTPQNVPYTQNPAFAQGFNPNSFNPPSGRSSAPPQNTLSTPHMQPTQIFPQQQGQQPRPQNDQQARMMYQMKLQQSLQQTSLMNAQRGNMPNPLARPPMQGLNGQPGSIPTQAVRAPNPEQFMKSLAGFMASKGLPLDMNPQVGDRQISLMSLYMAVLKFGGYERVTRQNGWGHVGVALGFQPMQYPNAAPQLKEHFERYLQLFEKAWTDNQNRQRQAQQQAARGMAGAGQLSPTKQMDPQAMQAQHQFMQQQFLAQQQQQMRLQQQHVQSSPVKQMATMQQPGVNGLSTPQAPHGQAGIAAQAHARNSLSRNMDPRGLESPQNGGPFTMPSPVSASKAGSISLPSPRADARPDATQPPQEFNLPDEMNPRVRVLDTYGGVEVVSLVKLGELLAQTRPDIPTVGELGGIDIHALTMSLQSGIHSEVRLALDTLASLSVESRLQLDLRHCDALVETLIDCAEVQVESLAENSAEVSDVMLVSSYEDIVRGGRQEQEVLQDIRAFGTVEYNLDRAVERLLCVTAILRNLSFHDANHSLLVDEMVIKFLCVVIRYLGTRNMLLRTNQNTLEFMKDIIIFLSNVAHLIELPGREQALCLLHFVLAFAPCPPPTIATSDRVTFTPYDPAIHRYLPPALDSLAKLLARDEPNRTHYKTIFAYDGMSSSPPFDLLTKTFGLSIAAIPDQDSKRGSLDPIVEVRKSYLMQGMLSAEILSNLAPGFESGLAKSWLMSEDGFAQNLSRLIILQALETPPQPPQQRTQVPPKGVEDDAILRITLGGIAVLQRLTEKSRDPEDPKSGVPLSGMPSKERLLQAMQTKNQRLQMVLKNLCAYNGLDI